MQTRATFVHRKRHLERIYRQLTPGLFNPVTEPLPLAEFDRVRAVVELLSHTSELQMKLAARLSLDGQSWTDPDESGYPMPSVDAPVYQYYPVQSMGPDRYRFLQIGFVARKPTGTTPTTRREVAVARLHLSFQSGAAPSGGA